MDKIPENFRRHIFKVQNSELNLSEDQSQFEKNLLSYTLKINVPFIIQGHICYFFHGKCFIFLVQNIIHHLSCLLNFVREHGSQH